MSVIQVNLMADSQGGSVAPISSVMRNRIQNGSMVISQRNGTSSVTVNNGTNAFIVDRWFANGESADGVFTGQQVTTSPVGFTNSLQFTVTTADTSIGATQSYTFRQRIEGFNTADLGWGTANASACTISFWVRSSVTGNFGGSIFNGDGNRIYPFSFTISAANTFEYKTITIAGDTSGTWNTTNGNSINLTFSLGVGSSNKGTAGAWSSTFAFAPNGSVDLIATNGATFYITGVQLEKGTQATSFEYRQYGTELALCQRYLEKSMDTNIAFTSANAAAGAFGQYTTAGSAGGLTTNFLDGHVPFRVEKRTNPTVTVFDGVGNAGVCTRVNPGVAANNNQLWGFASQGTSGFSVSSTSGASAGRFAFHWMASAEL